MIVFNSQWKRFLSYIVLIFLSFSFPFSSHSQTMKGTTEKQPTLLVESIEIIGNSKTRREVILGLLDFTVGEKIDRQRLNNNLRRLENTNFFKSVNIYTQPGSSRGRLRVFIEITERHGPFFQFRSGYNELDGWYLSPLGIRFDNLFGRGNYLGAEFLIGDRVGGLNISFFRRNIWDANLDFRLLLFSRTRRYIHFVEDERFFQEVKSGGLSLRLNGNRGLLKYLSFEFIKEKFTPDDFMWLADNRDDRRTLPDILRPFSNEKEIGRVILSLSVDTRDRGSYPTGGWWGSLSFDQVSSELGGSADFQKVVADIRRYQALVEYVVLAVRVKGAWVNDDAPFYEKFYLGGPNSLRGYEDRSLNPLGYASRLVQGSVELRVPFSRKNFPDHRITGVLFYEAGQAWNEPDDFDVNAFHSGMGYGFRLKLPIVGLLRLDFAYSVPGYDFKFHLSLGHTF